jgi:predicted GIY-YIG superfamily endonuclease
MAVKIRKPNGYWTLDNCANEALKYFTKIDFKNASMSAYVIANRNGWMKEISAHMTSNGNRFKRCIYSYEFSDNSVYVGLTFNLNERQINRDSHITDAVTKHIIETQLKPIRKQLTKYVDVEEACVLEGKFLIEYKTNGWNILNVKQTGGIGGNTLFWIKENCISVANQCNTISEFIKQFRGAYSSALKNGWLYDICKHMVSPQKPKGFWNNKNNCMVEAIKYESRGEFRKYSYQAYCASNKNNWLNEFYCK